MISVLVVGFVVVPLLAGAPMVLRRPARDVLPVGGGHVDVPSLSASIGRWLRRRFGYRSVHNLDRRLGRRVIIGVVLVGLSPLLAIGFVCGSYSLSIVGKRRRSRVESEVLRQGLGEVIDLFAMALSSGHTISAAIEQAKEWSPEPFGVAFTHCADEIARGRSVSDALDQLPIRLGPSSRPLVAALVAHDRYGAPIAQNLAQLAADARADHRRRAEAEARRLPVTLLVPLVTCVLPAFLLLTVLPVLAETLSTFDLSASP